ncbi:zinc finger C3H1 domain-containing protein isoform X2 [Biomphalaria glabrata]|nr:zinc finger C3H1 domain-containing protein isoform X2 [Biomphalaria glabrata]
MMITSSNTTVGAKEEGELTDDDCDENSTEQNKQNQHSAILKDIPIKKNFSKYDPSNDLNHFKSKRRDGRNRRVESSRSYRYLEDGGNRHRQHESGQKIQAEIPQQSKMWQKRRFRASSVRPLSPLKVTKVLPPKINGSPKSEHGDDLIDCTEDELVLRQALIQDQLKHLEEEEKAFGNHAKLDTSQTNVKVSEKADAFDEGRAYPIVIQESTLLNEETEKYIVIEDEKSDVELRRLALATSERHNRNLVSLRTPTVTGYVDLETRGVDATEVIDLVNEEEEEKKKIKSGTQLCQDKPKLKTRRKTDVSTKGQSAVKSRSRNDLRSTVQRVNKDKQKKTKRDAAKTPLSEHMPKSSRKLDEGAFAEKCEHLRLLAQKDPKLAIEQFSKLINDKEQQISVTGTMKDFKRQRKIPVLSEKFNFHSHKLFPKKNLDLKSKFTRKSLDRKSGLTEDNYDEVAMEIESDAEKDEHPSPLDNLQLGEDFMQAMQPLLPYSVPAPTAPPHYQHSTFSTHPYYSSFILSAPLPPPMPLLPPPPPPPPPDENESQFKVSGSDFVQSRQHHFATHPTHSGYAPTEASVYGPESIARQLHELREAQNSSGYLTSSKSFSYKPPSNSQRFVFSEENRLPLRPKIDYSSLNDFEFEKKKDSNCIQNMQPKIHASTEKEKRSSPLSDVREVSQNFVIQVQNNSTGNRKVHQKSDRSPTPSYNDYDDQQRPLTVLDNNILDDNMESLSRSPSQYSVRSSRHSYFSPSPPLVVKKYPRDKIKTSEEAYEPLVLREHYRDKYLSTEKSCFSYSKEVRDGVALSPHEATRNRISLSPHDSVRDNKTSKRNRPFLSPERQDKSLIYESFSLYEPQAPPNKQKRYSSPPPYIPTSIKQKKSSDSEEDDYIMREKLLATVIGKRKSKLEVLSNCSSPSGMSPKYHHTAYSEERSNYTDTNDNVMSASDWKMALATSSGDETDEEIKPPPVLSRLFRSYVELKQPHTLAVLCKLTMLKSKACLGNMSSEFRANENSIDTIGSQSKEPNESVSNVSGALEEKLVEEQLTSSENVLTITTESSFSVKIQDNVLKETQAKVSNIADRLGPDKSSEPTEVLRRLGPEKSSEPTEVLRRLGPQLKPNLATKFTSARNILATSEQSNDQTASKSSTPERIVSVGDKSSKETLTDKITHELSVLREKTEQLVTRKSGFMEASSLIIRTPTQQGHTRQVLTQDTLTQVYPQKRPFNSSQLLPIHPQVVVPLVSSDSEEEIIEKLDTLSKTETLLDPSSTRNEFELLKKEETYLMLYKQKIYKEQGLVKQLLEKAMKIVKAQQGAEVKRKKIQASIAKLTEQLKIAEKIANSFKTQKEETEKEVQTLTKKLVKTKNLLKVKEASVVSLGKKLLGPTYIPRLAKESEQILKAMSTSATTGLTRAESIALEKQKLIEKEKEIAEKLIKLKELKNSEQKDTPNSVVIVKSKSSARSQDLIRIDSNAKPDFVTKNRRRSLIDITACNTPNIPMTPRSKLKEKQALRDVPKPVPDQEETTFKMPSGTQLNHLCKLQAEKMEKYLKGLNYISFNQPLTSLVKSSSPHLKLCLEDHKDKGRHEWSRLSTPLTYTSSLLMFKSYRLSSFFRTKENLGFQSVTYSNKINPDCVFCPYDLQGTCNDDSCQQQHPKDYILTEKELLEDIVSYCPELAGVKEKATPLEIEKCIGSYVENVLAKSKGKITTDELCLWLSSEVKSAAKKSPPHMINLESRSWKPQSKKETGLSLHLNQRLTKQGVESINTEKVVDKDVVINEEDIRYFTADSTDLLSLEAEIMEDKTKSELWQRLAHKKLTDPNRSPVECLDQALNVLARGLEENRQDSILWLSYLQLYRKHPEAQNFLQFCQTALDLAPSYDLWFLFISSLHTFTEKDEACNQALEYLWKRSEQNIGALQQQTLQNSELTLNNTTIVDKSEDSFGERDTVNQDVEMTASDQSGPHTIQKLKDRIDQHLDSVPRSLASLDVPSLNVSRHSMTTKVTEVDSKASHELLEMILLKAGLNLQAGKLKTALHFIQGVLCLKKVDQWSIKFSKLLSVSDQLSLWLVYLYVLEFHHLPPMLYSDFNQNPGKLMSKDTISIPWTSKPTLHTPLDTLVKLYKKAFEVWDQSEKDSGSTSLYIRLVQSLVQLLVSQGKFSESVSACRHALKENRQLVDLWLLLADLFASNHDINAVKQVFQEALDANKYCTKLQFYLNLFLTVKGEADTALLNLEQFVMSHFESSNSNLHLCDPTVLYSQLLKQDEAFGLQMPVVKDDLASNLAQDIYMWLCYNLLMELEGDVTQCSEVYEKMLTHAETRNDLLVIWQNYIQYMVRTKSEHRNIRDLVCRSLLYMPVKRPMPFNSSTSATWHDYSHANQLVEMWLSVLPDPVKLDLMEMCLGCLPGDIDLLLRVVELCLELKETRRAYSLCKTVALQAEKPANGAFWKMALALAQREGTQREVEQMLVGCVETMPLAVAGWKDFLLMEVTCENSGAIEVLLKHCQQLGLNIDGFVSTISAPAGGTK